MPRNLVRNVDVLQTRDVLHRSQTSDGIQASTSGTEEVVEYPIIPCESVHEASGDYAPGLEPCLLWGGHTCTEEKDVLHDAECFCLGELKESIEDHTSTERETDESNGSYAEVAMEENISEDAAGRLCTVKGIRPWVVDEIPKFGENWKADGQSKSGGRR